MKNYLSSSIYHLSFIILEERGKRLKNMSCRLQDKKTAFSIQELEARKNE